MGDSLKIKGSCEVIAYKKGKEIWRKKFENVITNDGMRLMLNHIRGTTSGEDATYNKDVNLTHIALGIDDTPGPLKTQTTLQDEKIRRTFDAESVDVSGDPYFYVGEMFLDNNEGNGETYKEIGIFTDDDPPGGLMIGRLLCGSIVKTSDIELRFKYKIELSNS